MPEITTPAVDGVLTSAEVQATVDAIAEQGGELGKHAKHAISAKLIAPSKRIPSWCCWPE